MPSGYKKHVDGVSRKAARGGASHRGSKNCNVASSFSTKARLPDQERGGAKVAGSALIDLPISATSEKFLEECDICLAPAAAMTTTTTTTTKAETTKSQDPQGECSICLESKTLFPIFSKMCRHPGACRSCLVEYYVDHSIPSVTNYPLQCFFPGCHRLIQTEQIERLVRTEEQLSRFHRNKVLAKAYESTRRTVVHCPYCDHPRQFAAASTKHRGTTTVKEHVLCCLHCKKHYYCLTNNQNLDAIVLDADTLRAAEMMGLHESSGQRDGWALCPQCNLLLSGGDGQDQIVCVCEAIVDWKVAKDRVKRIRKHIRSTI